MCRSFFLFGVPAIPPGHRASGCAMARVDVRLQWALCGSEVKTWCGIPNDALLSDLVSDELDKMPGEIGLTHNSRRMWTLHLELFKFQTAGQDDCLTFELVRTHAYKPHIIQLVVHLCIDGVTAVRSHELGVVVTFPLHQPQRFSHEFAAMRDEFAGKPETHFQAQVLELMVQDLPGCVLRRKVNQFVQDSTDCTEPRAIRCVLVFDADGSLSLRMDLRRFRVVDSPSSNDIVKTAIGLIHAAYAA